MINNEIALTNVRDILNILADHGTTAWAQDGTLLGLVRDGCVIPWDHDTDTGCFATDWTGLATPALEAAGFHLDLTLGTPEDGWQHRWSRDGVKTDIFFYYTNPDTTIWHAAYLQLTHQYRFTYDRFDLAPLDTSVGPMLAPAPPEVFLETKYGPTWQTPTRAWNFATSPLNSRPNQ